MNAIEVEKYTEEDYDNMLDDCYDPLVIGDITLDASRVLKECDPIAYNCGFSDYQEYMYECSQCGEKHEVEEEAEDCCKEEECKHENIDLIWTYIPGEAVKEPGYEQCIDCDKIF